MKLDKAKFCTNFSKKLELANSQIAHMSSDHKAIEQVFHFIHELNGVALSYGFENIGSTTKVAHEVIYTLFEHKKFPTGNLVDLFEGYFSMLEQIFNDQEETHFNTKEALHLIDDFQFYIQQHQHQAA